MAKKKRTTPAAAPLSSESSRVEALTAFWMLSAVTALVCELGLLAVYLYFRGHPAGERGAAIYLLLWLTSAVVGTLTLILTPIVWRMRREPPPRPVAVAAVLIGLAPWLTLIF